jgi:uncharacterized protein
VLVLICDLAPDYLERRGSFRDSHLGLAREAHDRGELLMAGAFSEPYDHSLFIWSTDDESVVTSFLERDPYVGNGVVTAWQIRKWTVAIGDSGVAG